MASEQQHCFSCGSATKYRCITCAGPVCNRSECSVPEENDEIDGWVANKSVAYCRDCNFQPGNFSDKTIFEHDEVEDEGDEPTKHNPKAKKNTGRKSLWTSEHLDDMVDAITNNESYKRKLIFTNNKRATNTEVYTQVLKQLKERHPSFPFTLPQMRTKFKWCISTCKKVALTIETASGIKRFVEDKGFGKWFDALFPLIKSRDSCQPEQAIEPSTSTSSSPCSTPSELEEDEEKIEDKTEGETRAMFVPIKKRKRKENEPGPADKMLKLLEEMVENDQTKDLLQFMREDAEKSRQHELECLRLLTGQSYGPSYSQGYAPPPTVPQTWQQEHYTNHSVPHHFQGTSPQSWRHFEAQVPQTPPSGRYPDKLATSPTFQHSRNYTQL